MSHSLCTNCRGAYTAGCDFCNPPVRIEVTPAEYIGEGCDLELTQRFVWDRTDDRRVPPLTDDEIVRLRRLLGEQLNET